MHERNVGLMLALRNNHRVGGLDAIRPRSGDAHTKTKGLSWGLCGLPLTKVWWHPVQPYELDVPIMTQLKYSLDFSLSFDTKWSPPDTYISSEWAFSDTKVRSLFFTRWPWQSLTEIAFHGSLGHERHSCHICMILMTGWVEPSWLSGSHRQSPWPFLVFVGSPRLGWVNKDWRATTETG